MREVSPMKQSYLTAAFQKTAKDYRAQTETLNSAFDARLSQPCRENAGVSPEKKRHLESKILPGIAAYETLQMVIAQRAGAANLSRLCGAAGMAAEKDLCAVAAYSGALSKSTRHLCGADPQVVWYG